MSRRRPMMIVLVVLCVAVGLGILAVLAVIVLRARVEGREPTSLSELESWTSASIARLPELTTSPPP